MCAAPNQFAPDNLAVGGANTTFTVIDGQKGDDDWTVNGTIGDPVRPATAIDQVPTLGIGTWRY